MIQIRRFGGLGALIILSMVLVSCGFGGDDEEEPTPTNTPEEASLNAEPTATEVPSTPDDPFALVTSTPADASSSPIVPNATGPGATIVSDQEPPDSASPEPRVALDADQESFAASPGADAGVTGVVDSTATPDPGDTGTAGTADVTSPANVGTGSDGTSGPDIGSVDEATPAADSNATPAASVNAIEVDSCDVVEVPPYAGSDTEFLTTEDVNFRSGPGSDCESLLDGPLGPNVAVEVIGGPVVRTDDPDGILWVQIVVNDETGWIAQEYLEATESE